MTILRAASTPEGGFLPPERGSNLDKVLTAFGEASRNEAFESPRRIANASLFVNVLSARALKTLSELA